MASSPLPRHRARPSSSAPLTLLRHAGAALRSRSARPGPVVAKTAAVTAAGGLVLALLVPSAPASAGTTVALAEVDALSADFVPAAFSAMGERNEQRASRSAVRAPAALQAPDLAGPAVAPTFGALSFTAVEKPPPPPPPPPPPAPTAADSGSTANRSATTNSGTSAAPTSSGGGYDWAAAQNCSCARGLTQNSMKVLAAVKASFPGMTNIGGVRPDSLPDHPSGRALDFMTSDRGYGDSIANMLINRSGELNVKYIIWYQRIWEPGKGWRQMSNRGSVTANHMDHVHVTVH